MDIFKVCSTVIFAHSKMKLPRMAFIFIFGAPAIMRFFFVLSFLYVSLFAEAAGYIGLSIEDSTEFFVLDERTVNASTPQYKIKAGSGDIGGSAVDAAFSYMFYATDVFSPSDGASF